jgi:hypothetical protein
MIAPEIFENLKANIEDDAKVREDLTQIVQKLDKAVSYTQGLLSQIHSTRRSECNLPLA